MSEQNNTFGSKVVGEEEAARAIEKAKGGGNVFGKRVMEPFESGTAEQAAKAASQFGPRTIGGASQQDQKGKRGSPSEKDIENMLEENPTFFDSLYEAELAREEGPRKAVLENFKVVEQGIKGAGRAHVIAEINKLLGFNQVTAAQRANQFRAQAKQIEEQEQRNEENAGLVDAGRIQSLVDREKNLETLQKSKNRGTQSQVKAVSADTDAQVRQIAEEEGLDVTGSEASKKSGAGQVEGGDARGTHTDLAEDDVKPETSQRTKRTSQKRKSTRKKTAAKK